MNNKTSSEKAEHIEKINHNKYKCPLEYTQKVVGGKWKSIILWYLSTLGTQRYGELKRCLENISHKMLSQQLKELEMDKLIDRKEYQQIPPKVEYSITERGKSLIPIIKLMHNWGVDNMNNETNEE